MKNEEIMKEKLTDKQVEDVTGGVLGINFDDLGADSLDVVDVVKSVETKLGITIPESDFGKLSTPAGIEEYIKQNQK